jgi:alpha-1,6-mannosyltransferase
VVTAVTTRLRWAAGPFHGPAAGVSIAGFAGAAVLVLVTSVPGPPPVMTALGLTGMGVVILAWLGLGRYRAELSIDRLYWTAAAWCLPLLVAQPLFSGDVHSYLAQGMTAAEGLDPYRLGPAAALGVDSPVTQQVSPYWQNTPAPYGPVAVGISRTIVGLAGDNTMATLALNRVFELAGVVLIAWALPRLARRSGAPPATAVWLGLLNPLVLWHVVAGAHYEGLMLGLMLAGLELALDTRSRPSRIIAGVVLLTFAINIKIVALAAVLCLGIELARRRGFGIGRAILVVLGLVAGVAAVSLLIAATSGLGLGWLRAVDESTNVHSWMAPTNQLGFLVGAFGDAGLTSTAIAVCVRVGALAGGLVVAWLSWRAFRTGRNPLTTLGQLFAVMLVAGPVVQAWYPLWAILPFCAAARTRRARRGIVAVSAVFALLLPPIVGGVSALIEGYLAAAVLLGLAGIAIHRKRARSLRRGAAGDGPGDGAELPGAAR